MRFDLAAPDQATALLFPGQGAHCAEMLEPFRDAARFPDHLERVCSLLGFDPLDEARRHPEVLDRNAVSSLLTVLASVACLDLLRAANASFEPVAAAGYSVGQWTALYAAGAMTAETLFDAVAVRARLMDACIETAGRSGMLAVIGVRRADVVEICDAADARGELVQITNDNAPGQYTLGGSGPGLDFAELRLQALSPKRLQRVPVAGAWHSRILEPVVARLRAVLPDLALGPTRFPVIDNNNGGWLPENADTRADALARQVASPVMWRQGIETIVKSGAGVLAEVGYGDLLTRFGFFIDRSVRHLALVPLPRAGR